MEGWKSELRSEWRSEWREWRSELREWRSERREQHSNDNHSSVGLGASEGNHTASLQVTEIRGQDEGTGVEWVRMEECKCF